MTQQVQGVEQGSAGRTALAILAGVIIVLACFAPLYVIVFTLNERRAPVLGTPTAEQNIPAAPGEGPTGTAPSATVRPPAPAVVVQVPRQPPPAAIARPPAATVPPVVLVPAPSPTVVPRPPAAAPPADAANPAAPAVEPQAPQAAAPPNEDSGAAAAPAAPSDAGNEGGMPFVRGMLPWLF